MAINKKFNFTIDDDKKQIIELAAKQFGSNPTDIVRIGAYQFALYILNNGIEDAFKDICKK